MVEITKLITESQLFATQYSSFLFKIESNLFSKQTKTNKKSTNPKNLTYAIHQDILEVLPWSVLHVQVESGSLVCQISETQASR